jgi:hypothetical protein
LDHGGGKPDATGFGVTIRGGGRMHSVEWSGGVPQGKELLDLIDWLNSHGGQP